MEKPILKKTKTEKPKTSKPLSLSGYKIGAKWSEMPSALFVSLFQYGQGNSAHCPYQFLTVPLLRV